MAIRPKFPQNDPIFHSSCGVQYASIAFRQRLAQLPICQSICRKGDLYDNAVAEKFFCCLKCELIHLYRYDSCSATQNAVFSYIKAFYYTLHPHSALGWLSPHTFRLDFLQPLVA